MLRRALVVTSIALLAACAAEDIESRGVLESPCTTSGDCETGLCIQLPEYSMCTRHCVDGLRSRCPAGYTCAGEGADAMCLPDPSAPFCRDEGLTCGSQFAACCAGLVCAGWADLPWHCASPCSADWHCASECCVLQAGGSGVCAPPSYC